MSKLLHAHTYTVLQQHESLMTTMVEELSTLPATYNIHDRVLYSFFKQYGRCYSPADEGCSGLSAARALYAPTTTCNKRFNELGQHQRRLRTGAVFFAAQNLQCSLVFFQIVNRLHFR